MSMNKFMHPRNIYCTPPDYTELAIKYPEFRKKCKLTLDGKCTLNLKEIDNVIELTKVLLKNDFDLTIDLPNDSLVPTVPLRLNYILWIEDIMSTMKIENPIGIDIGCGASCIYSILIAKKNNWKMFALEINEKNLEYAKKNVKMNNLTDKVEIFHQSNKYEIFGPFLNTTKTHNNDDDDVIFDFCLCNPPFFDINSQENPDRSNERPSPKNVATGKIDELLFEGGEVIFVKKIIDESFIYRNRIKIFTTMIGRKIDLLAILKILKEKNITNFIQAEFCQGNTTRWGLAWTFYPNLILGLVPFLGYEKTDKQKKSFSCNLKWKKYKKNWKNQFLEEINKMEFITEILHTTTENNDENEIKLIAKLFKTNPNDDDDDDTIKSSKKRKIDKNPKQFENEINKNVVVNTVETNEENVTEVVMPSLSDESSCPILVFQIDVKILNDMINLKVTYLCGSLGVDGCYKWFCLIKNKIL